MAATGPIAIPVAAAPVATGAQAALATETAVATAAMQEQVAVVEGLGAADQKAAASAGALEAAQRAAAKAALALSEVASAAAASTTELAAARATLAAADRAVLAGESALGKALLAENEVLIATTADTLRLATAQQVQAKAAFDSARANKTSAVTAAESAAAHEQLSRGAGATVLAMGGLRGAVLAASSPFILGSAAAILFAKSIREASDRTEELNKTTVVFGQSATQIQDFARTTADSLGISEVEALRATGIFGNLFRSIQISQPVAAGMSERLVRLASDLASFNNADPSRTLDALRSGLVGQARPLRVFGIFLSQARAQQQALIDTGKQNVKELTNAEIVQARYNIILRDSIIAQGDFINTQSRLANQSRILRANLADLEGELGRRLIPALGLVVATAIDYVQAFKRMDQATSDLAGNLPLVGDRAKGAEAGLAHVAAEASKTYFKVVLLGPALFGATKAMDALGIASETTGEKLTVFEAIAGSIDNALAKFAASLELVQTRGFKTLTAQLNALEVQQLKIQTGLAPGGRAAEEANLRAQIADDKKAVALSKSGTAARRRAIEELKADQDALEALLKKDASDAQDRADRIERIAREREQAARKAAQAQVDATQAFIEAFAPRQQRLENRLTSAQLFGTATQQIAANRAIRVANIAEIHAIQAFIRQQHLHGEALKAAREEIKRIQQENFNLTNSIIQLQTARRQAVIDARQSHLEAQLAIAETTASTRDDVAAEKALIKFDQAQIRRILAIKRRRRLTLEEAAQLDAYRVDLAQRNEALRKTQEEQKKGSETAQAFFKFLQTQAGFAANLLGNLIPGGATGGLVGGTTGQTGPSPQLAALQGQPQERANQVAAIAGSRDRGVRPVQVDTTNQILRHILRVLQQQTGRMGHPEARYQKATSNAVLDTEHGHG